MALNNTMNDMERLLKTISDDLEKTIYGNKAAAQRVRTGTIRMEKIAKLFRKESIHAEKKGLLVRKPRPKKSAKKSDESSSAHAGKKALKAKGGAKKSKAKKASKSKSSGKSAKAGKASASKAKASKGKAPAKKGGAKKSAPKKAMTKKASAPKRVAAPKKKMKAKPRTLSLRRPTAKLPRKHMRAR